MTTKTAVDTSKKKSTMSRPSTSHSDHKSVSSTPKSSPTPKRPVRIRDASPTFSEKTDPDSEKSPSLIVSPTEDNDHHGSIEQAIKSIEEQIKSQQQRFAKRLLSRQHKQVEYRNDNSSNTSEKMPPSQFNSAPNFSEQGSGGYTRSEPLPYSSESHKLKKSQSLATTKKVTPKQIKNICTCGDPHSSWCHVCELRRFKSAFPKWTSGSKVVDNFIRETQLNSSSELNYLEWISYDRFREVKEIGDGAYAKLFSAIWLDGPRIIPDEKKKFKREVRKKIILRQLHNSQHITESFFNELEKYYRSIIWNDNVMHCYGMSKDPVSKNYIMVFENVENGDLHNYLTENIINMSWQFKLAIACDIAKAIKTIHHVDIIHRDIHCGNILILKNGYTQLADLGICRNVNDDTTSDEDGKVQCVLPFTAPEVILNKTYSKESDIYSFSMIMWELSSGKRPFHDKAHDVELALEICGGIRPPIDNTPSTPPCWNTLMEQCWDQDPLKRPNANIIHKTLYDWLKKIVDNPRLPYKVNTEFALAENWRYHKVHQVSQEYEKIHPLAFYTSQIFDFSELQPEKYDISGSPDVIEVTQNEIDVKCDTQDDIDTKGNTPDGVDEIDIKCNTPDGIDVKYNAPDEVDVKCNTPPSETENTFEPPQSPTKSSKISEIESKYDGATSPSGESTISFKADQSEHLDIEF